MRLCTKGPLPFFIYRTFCESSLTETTTKATGNISSTQNPRQLGLIWVSLPRENMFSCEQGPDVQSEDGCIEMLRQLLMCNANTGIITYEWVEGSADPHPDFNTVHRCRNLDNLQKWNFGHSAMVPVSHITRFADTIDLPTAP